MPRTNLAVQAISRTTLLNNPTRYTPDAVNGNTFDNTTGRVMLYIINGGAGSITLTVRFNSITLIDGQAPANPVYTIAAGGRLPLPFFKTNYYNQTDNSLLNRVLLDWSASTSVTVEVMSLPTT